VITSEAKFIFFCLLGTEVLKVQFGTSGLRGLARDLTAGIAWQYSRAFARHLKKQAQSSSVTLVLVAADLRASSPAIKQQVIGGLLSEGMQVIDCGELPTPILAYAALTRGGAAIMVTGSHIPADRNGLKFYLPGGEISKADEVAISALAVECLNFKVPETSAVRVLDGLVRPFLERYIKCLPAGILAGLRVGIYEHSTVARDPLRSLLVALGAEIVRLGHEENFVAVDTETVEDDTKRRLAAWARAHRLDAIVSADGDGDRPLVTDEQGSLLRGDLLGIIVANFLNADVVVTPVTTNSGTEVNIGATIIRTRVGSPYVVAGMEKAKRDGYQAVLGFEANGGVLLGSDFKIGKTKLEALQTRDAFLPILCALVRCAQKAVPMSEMVKSYVLPHALAVKIEDFPVSVSRSLMLSLESEESTTAWLAPFGEVTTLDRVDGLRAMFSNGSIVHLRPSGNAPEMRCYVEATSSEEAVLTAEVALELISKSALAFQTI
jgi:phosphomannomutase